MAANGPILYIDNNVANGKLFTEVMQVLAVPNEIIIFETCKPAMDYLCTTKDQPFIIVCDLVFPLQSGLDFKKDIDDNPFLRRKSIPFIFYSIIIDQAAVNTAYTNLSTQGYFQKPLTFDDTKVLWQAIITYWKNCYHPNSKLP